MHWRSIDVMKRILAFLFMAIAALPLRAQLEFLAPSMGKKLFYEVEYTSPMGNGEFYVVMVSREEDGKMVCDITFHTDSLFLEKYSVLSVTYRDSADLYIVNTKDIMAFLMPNLSGLKQVGTGGEVMFPKITEPGERYKGSSVKLQGMMDNMAVTMDVNLGEIVVHPSEPVEVPYGKFNAMKVTNESEISLLNSPQKLYFTIWYKRGLGPLRFSVSSMEGLMKIDIALLGVA